MVDKSNFTSDFRNLAPDITVQHDEHGCENYYLCSDTGYVMHVSAIGKTVEEARGIAYNRIGNIVMPKMFYRTDIGIKFLEKDRDSLQQWGYV